MMNLLRYFTFRSFQQRPLRMLLSTFGIILGVATIIAVGVTNINALRSITQLFEDTSGKADLIVTTSDGEDFSERLVEQFAHYSAIVYAVPLLHINTALADADVSSADLQLGFFGTSEGGLMVFGIDPQLDLQARTYNITQGSFLSEDALRNEIVLVETFAEDNDIEIGESIALIGDVGTETFHVVGLIAKEGPGKLNNGAFGVIGLAVGQVFSGREREIDQIDLVIQPEQANVQRLEQIKAELQQILGEDYSVLFPADQGQRMTSMLSDYQIGLNFLSGMSLFVGAFLIYNAFSMSVVERTREIGMLRCVGLTRAQVIWLVISEAAVLGLIGSSLGVGFGILLSQGLSGLMSIMLALDVTELSLPREVIALGAGIGFFVALVAAVIPALQAGRISPLEALRVYSRSENNWIVRFGWLPGTLLMVFSVVVLMLNPFPYDVQFRLGSMVVFTLFVGGVLLIPVSVNLWERMFRSVIAVLFGRVGKLGSVNIQRSKMRTTLTVAALMIGVSMMVVVWAMTESFKTDLDAWIEGYIGGDLYVSSSLPMSRASWYRIESVEGVYAATPIRYLEVVWQRTPDQKENIAFMGFDPTTHEQVTSFLFDEISSDPQAAMSAVAAGDHVFISSVISQKYGLIPGDTIQLVTRRGRRDFTIAAVVVDYYNEGMVISGSWNDMRRYFYEEEADALMIRTRPGFEPTIVGNLIDDRYGRRDDLIIISNQSLQEQINTLMNQAFIMFDVLAMISLLVGFFSISNTMTMNVIERTREIGMLRAVGMTRFQVQIMILAEAVLIGLIGGIIGLVFGVILSRIFIIAMTAMSGYSLVYQLPLTRVLVALIISVIVSQIAALIPAARATRIDIIEAVNYD
jgi:putative ABC transport system permease protein